MVASGVEGMDGTTNGGADPVVSESGPVPSVANRIPATRTTAIDPASAGSPCIAVRTSPTTMVAAPRLVRGLRQFRHRRAALGTQAASRPRNRSDSDIARLRLGGQHVECMLQIGGERAL